jgi:hypothetical protein
MLSVRTPQIKYIKITIKIMQTATIMDTDREDLFEVFGVYFANYYWNNLYNKALRAWSDENFPNIENAYREMLDRYNSSFCTESKSNERLNQDFVNITHGIHKQYEIQTGEVCTYYNFIDSVVRCFVPHDFYKRIADFPKKMNIFRIVMSKTLTLFTIYVCQKHIPTVVDVKVREDSEASIRNVKLWKQTFKTTLDEESKTFYHLCMAQRNGVQVRREESINSISREVYEKLQEKVRQLIEEKNDLVKERNKLAQLAITYKKILLESRGSVPKIVIESPSYVDEASDAEEYNELLDFIDEPELKSDD